MVENKATKGSGRAIPTPSAGTMQPEISNVFDSLAGGGGQHANKQQESNNHSANQGVTDNRDWPDLIGKEFVELLRKARAAQNVLTTI
ncbi:hypothetical protein MJO28_000316 [Puccinia striiformis f. sp. tritici]|uniref:Uncharacterized protein n=1 Tax=Puccinia striiformis f. sp. tritici TaxID=168172 RepID=A0ACC0EXS7_9BASI|nr:hypothetical protein MJO28_000316 [Puccinia striiformis f. sp. tritici]